MDTVLRHWIYCMVTHSQTNKMLWIYFLMLGLGSLSQNVEVFGLMVEGCVLNLY